MLLVDVILCPTCGITNINPEHVAMVADVDFFLSYPWDRESVLKTVRSAKTRNAKRLAQDTCAIQGFSHALVLVTVSCCTAIIPNLVAGFNLQDPSVPNVVQHVVERNLTINLQTARVVDQTGQVRKNTYK